MQEPCGGAFTAAGHANEDNVFHIVADGLPAFRDQAVLQRRTQEPLRGLFSLGNQHPKTAESGQTQFFGIHQKPGAGRIVNDIQNTFQTGQCPQVYRRDAGIRVHSNGGSINQNRGIGMLGDVLIIVLTAA